MLHIFGAWTRRVVVPAVSGVLVATSLGQDAINLEPVVSGLVAPIGMAHCGDNRLFVVEQRGQIRVIQNGALLPAPFLDVSNLLVPARAGFDERGLLGLAFHPNYQSNGRFFIYYSAPRPPDISVSFDEPGIPIGVNDFTVSGVHFVGGVADTLLEPPLYSSGANGYLVPAGTTATITLPQPVAIVRLFLVHRAGETAGNVQAFDGGGTLRATVPSRVATVMGDPANFVTIDQSTNGIAQLRLNAPASASGQMFTLFADDVQTFNFHCKSVLAEYHVSAGNPNVADPGSARTLLEVNKPQFNHNGGQLNFGPDGYLYLGTGDGGNAGDSGLNHLPSGNAQSLTTLLGKFLRIDVDGALPYGIPADNPFVGVPGALAEIWAYGMRNPWRFSFDRGGTHQLFCSDVGQNLFEEVDIITRGGNFGWRIREALHCFDPSTPNSPPPTCPINGANGDPLIDPIHEYPHTLGISATGGYVYRGGAMPELNGQYIFGDWSTSFSAADGSIFRLQQTAPGVWQRTNFIIRQGAEATQRFGRYVSSFGEDPSGELYVCSQKLVGFSAMTGMVHKLKRAPTVGDLNCDGLVNNFDIDPFILAISDPAAYQAQFPTCPLSQADINGDGLANNFDIDPLVDLLAG